MYFGLFTYGSRGDVQPFIPLALGLMEKGHRVTLAAPGNFRELVEGYGIAFHPLYGDAEQILHSPECERIIKTGSDIAFVRFMFNSNHNMRIPLFESVYEGCKKADAIICVNTLLFLGGTIAEKLDKKWLIVQLNPPMIPTRIFPLPALNAPGISWLNPYTYHIINDILWRIGKKDILEVRNLLGLPRLKKSSFNIWQETGVPVIHAYSPELIARPNDWEDQYTVSGFFNLLQLRQEYQSSDGIPPGLADWLNAGEKPVYIGFGSIPVPNSVLLKNIIDEILLKSNTRILFCMGWSKIEGLPVHPNLFVVKQINHNWLFPKCKAAVIHGGIGTLAAVLYSGIPVIIISIFADQPIWGRIIVRKKIGVHIPWRKLSAAKLLNALNEIEQHQIIAAAAEAGNRINKENGVKAAIESIEAYFIEANT